MSLAPISSSNGLLVSSIVIVSATAFLLRHLWPALATGPLARTVRDYESELQKQLIFLHAPVSTRRFLALQAALIGCGLLILFVALPVGALMTALGLLAPVLVKNARKKRTLQLETQIEGWLTSMARCLEAAPSLGEALESSVTTCDAPMREEIEQLVSEVRLGRPMDRALSEWSDRVGSRTLTMAVATLLVGRETGGQIGDVLRSAASALREMERLEGVVRTKTAEGKAQAWVISIVPFPLYIAVRATDPSYFLPLEQTATGHLLLAVAAGLWIAAALCARKILAVRI